MTFSGLLHLAGCSVGTPPADEVDAIEELTLRDACVGSLSRWHRTFQFARRGFQVDKNIVDVAYERVGQNVAAGRSVIEPDRNLVIDDSMRPIAWGYYDRAAQRFSEWTCGCSFPPYNSDQPTECVGDSS